MSPTDARAQALAESRFVRHLLAFAVVTSALLGVNLLVGPWTPWAAWAGVAWALVVASHGAAVFRGVLSNEWVERRAAALEAPPAATGPVEASALREVDRRLRALEAALAPPPAPDPFDLVEARDAGRPVAPTEAAFFDDDDPFAGVRGPVETPRLDGPPPPLRARR